jgi:hypothetical protein
VLSFAQHKGREEKGWEHLVPWWVLVAGRLQDTNESLSTWLRAAAAAAAESERGATERERERSSEEGRRMQRTGEM